MTPTTSKTGDGTKRLIGTVQSNYPVTTSARVGSLHPTEVGSKLFMKIATDILSKMYKARFHKDIVESIMLRFKRETQKIPKIVKVILDFFKDDTETLRNLNNQELNRKLVRLADISRRGLQERIRKLART
ncbi:hypothetical protein K501DRAFT_279438 [Backusella circina FSU 941]|nr:hypothetical protein K501DRAFT_279438 [Backusella circina FSU 941]